MINYDKRSDKLRKLSFVIVVIVFVWAFYWVAMRPYFVRTNCQKIAAKDSLPSYGTDKTVFDRYMMSYTICAHHAGLAD